MNVFKKTLLTTLVMTAAANAFAANTADLIVTGTISPVACTPSFVGGGAVDYGNISASLLSPTVETKLTEKEVSYTITCDAPIVMATKWLDARQGTATGSGRFGLGKAGDVNIGSYHLKEAASDLLANGAPAAILYSSNKGVSWVSTAVQSNTGDGKELVSYAAPGTVIPRAYSTVAGKLKVTALIAPTAGFDLSQDISLDGLATMEVIYL